jgi:hypothetical protein
MHPHFAHVPGRHRQAGLGRYFGACVATSRPSIKSLITEWQRCVDAVTKTWDRLLDTDEGQAPMGDGDAPTQASPARQNLINCLLKLEDGKTMATGRNATRRL